MIINRIGTFFILVGVSLIGLFIYSDIVDAPACNLLLFGGATFVLGLFLWFRNPVAPAQPSGRFRLFRKHETKKDERK